MSSTVSETRTFDALINTNLDQVYDQGREEDLRDRAFRILLKRADSVNKLEKLVFKGERGFDGWTTKELIEILNHFRLLSSPRTRLDFIGNVGMMPSAMHPGTRTLCVCIKQVGHAGGGDPGSVANHRGVRPECPRLGNTGGFLLYEGN